MSNGSPCGTTAAAGYSVRVGRNQTISAPMYTCTNEFNTEGCFSCAFRTLFSTGAAGCPAPRPRAVITGYYFNVAKAQTSSEDRDVHMEELISYINKTFSTINPAVQLDGSDIDSVPQTNSHICNKPYTNVVDFSEDLFDLVATCKGHNCCSAAYCISSIPKVR